MIRTISFHPGRRGRAARADPRAGPLRAPGGGRAGVGRGAVPARGERGARCVPCAAPGEAAADPVGAGGVRFARLWRNFRALESFEGSSDDSCVRKLSLNDCMFTSQCLRGMS